MKTDYKQCSLILNLGTNNSCSSLFPHDVLQLVRRLEPIQENGRIFTQVTEQYLVLYSDKSLHLVTLQRKECLLNKKANSYKITQRPVVQNIPLGKLQLLRDPQNKCHNLYAIQEYQSRPQDHWVDIHMKKQLFDHAILQSEMTPYFSTIDEQQQVNLGPIVDAFALQDENNETKLACCTHTGFALCQEAYRLIPHDLLRKESEIQGYPELFRYVHQNYTNTKVFPYKRIT